MNLHGIGGRGQHPDVMKRSLCMLMMTNIACQCARMTYMIVSLTQSKNNPPRARVWAGPKIDKVAIDLSNHTMSA